MTAQPDIQPLAPDEPAGPQPSTAHAMIEVLRRHYLPDESRPAGIFAPEIQAPGPTQRRADLIWLGCTAATGSQLVGHEIKVSRADVLTELADLTKSDPWQRYCDRWYLVIPHVSLIDGLELPESWGVLTPPSGRRTRSITVHRQAPPLKPAEQSPALRTLAAWVHWRLRDSHNGAREQKRRLEQTERANQELRLHAPRDPSHGVVARIITELGGVQEDQIGDWWHRIQVDDVVAALRDRGSLRERHEQAQWELRRVRNELESARKGIVRLLSEMNGDRAPKTTE